jgi:hypothetical protein
MTSLRRLVILFLLAWMPLQAVAAPLLAWHCASHDGNADSARAGSPPCHSGDAAAAVVPSATEEGQTQGTACGSGDFCCAHFSALPTMRIAGPVDRAPFEALLPTLPDFSFLSSPLTQPPRA